MIQGIHNGKGQTTSAGKLQSIQKQVQIIEEFKRRFNVSFKGKHIVGLPGAGSQCSRHIDEYKAYGFAEQFIHLGEYVESIYGSIAKWATKNRFKGKLNQGDVYQYIAEHSKAGTQIAMKDLDGCGAVGDYMKEQLRLSSETGTDVVVFTCSAGTGCRIPNAIKQYKKELGIRRRYNKYAKALSTPVSEISERIIAKWAIEFGFEVHGIPYKGKQGKGDQRGGSQMISFVCLNTGKYGATPGYISKNWRISKEDTVCIKERR